MFGKSMTLFQFYKEFDTEQKCVDYLIKIRWGGKILCPHCGHDRCYTIKADKRNSTKYKIIALWQFKCANNKCYKKFTATTGTALHSTKVPLWQFFYLIFSSAINKKNVSSYQQALNLGIAQKTCWYIMMRIRMMCYQDASLRLGGTVEVDETYLAAGKWEHRIRFAAGKKTPCVCGRKIPVLGLLQRNGKVVVRVIPNKNRKTVLDIILKHVETGSSLFTDSAACYINLDSYYLHETVNHREGEYVRGYVYTNSIENFWTNIRGAIMGTHGGVSIQHLQRYCDEVVYRWNTKGMSPLERFNDLLKRACVLRPTLEGKVRLGAMAARKQKALNRKMIV